MYLVDTSVWIDYFKEVTNHATKKLISILDRRDPFGITSVIYQEILQGAASEKDFTQLKTYFSTQLFFEPQDAILTYEAAAKLLYLCRKKGITIRSTIDCFIAQIAIENNLVLLHNDKDYKQIQTIAPKLSLVD